MCWLVRSGADHGVDGARQDATATNTAWQGSVYRPELVGVSQMREHFTAAHELEYHEQVGIVLQRPPCTASSSNATIYMHYDTTLSTDS